MALVFPVLLAILVGLALGGRLGALAELPLRAPWLFLLAFGLQVVAFPFSVLPWTTHMTLAKVLWLTSYAILVVGMVLNVRIRGVAIVGAGMCANIAAILANGGTMPVLPGAMHDAGRGQAVVHNSTSVESPALPWLVDRWAAPDWIPLANVFSVGDVAIAVGALVLVLCAMGPRVPSFRVRRLHVPQ